METREGLKGITIGGQTVEEWLEAKEKSEKSQAILAEHRAATKATGYHGPRGIYADNTTGPRVAKRVKRWSDREIRKEYGIMNKPFGTHYGNALWVIMEQGPVTVNELGEAIKWEGKKNSLGALVAGIWKRLGTDGGAGILTRQQRKGGVWEYKRASDSTHSVEAAIHQYKVRGTQESRDKRAKARGQAPPEQPQVNQALVDDAVREIGKGIEEAVSKALGVQVQVSGRVEIVFKWER